MANAKMQITIDGDAKGAVNATKQVSSQFSNLMKIFGAGVLAGGGLMLAQKGMQALSKAMSDSIKFVKESIELQAFQEIQITKLNTALK